MAVRFTEDLVPIEEDPARLYPNMNADEHIFADVTVTMVRDIILNDIAAGAVGYRINRCSDPRHVLGFIKWWNSLPTTHQRIMPMIAIRHPTVQRIGEMKDLCHVCYNKLKNISEMYADPPNFTCTVCNNAADAAADGTTGMKRDEQVAAAVRRDLERLHDLVHTHRRLCQEKQHYGVLKKFKKMVQQRTASRRQAWIKAVNAEFYIPVVWSPGLYGVGGVDRFVPNATMQMKAFDTLMMPRPQAPLQMPVLARLDALDDVAYAEQKVAIRRALFFGFLNNVKPANTGNRRSPLRWTPEQQPDVLRRAMQSIETYEQEMQCTQLALVVRTLFRQYNPEQADNSMAIVPKLVNDFLGPTEYDEAELMNLWNLPLESISQPAGRDAY